MIKLVPATAAHTRSIVNNLRDHDSFEFKVFGVGDNELELRKILIKSPYAWTALVDDEPACMWGLKEESLMTGAYIWLVTTPLIEDHVFSFLRESRRVIEYIIDEYPFIHGYVDESYTKSRRWLKWLGFTELSEMQYGDMKLVQCELRGPAWQ